jgi:hypothetical protein
MKHIGTTTHLSIKNPEQALEKLLLEREKRAKYYWKMKDGSEILVDFMSDQHLDNTIKMLQKRVNERALYEDAAEGFPDDWEEDCE